jgi:outer membrane lipoprotein-sorting protein
MMRSRRLHSTLLLVFTSLLTAESAVPAQARAQTPSVDALFAQSLTAIKAVDSYQGQFAMRELIGDELKTSKVDFKFMRPFKVYMLYITPSKGQEVLYVQGENNGELKAHKGSFPDITVNLNPYGRAAMKGSHQPIQTFGVQKQIEIMGQIYRKAKARGDANYTVSDGGVFMGEPVWKVEAKLPSTGDLVKVREDEDGNLWKFAKRVGQTMYVILHYNGIKSPGSIDEGDEIFVPHHYGSRLQYLVGQKSLMPLQETSWDHKGRVYESYDYPVLKLNAGLTAKDFDPENEAYDF